MNLLNSVGGMGPTLAWMAWICKVLAWITERRGLRESKLWRGWRGSINIGVSQKKDVGDVDQNFGVVGVGP